MDMRNLVLALGLLILFIQCAPAQNKPKNMSPFDFEKAWKEVEEHESKGLPESALKVVSEIVRQAKTRNEAGQLVKGIIHQMKFTGQKEDDAFIKNLGTLRDEATQAAYPVKPVLHSMLAELYWQYYQANRYRFLQRTATVNQTEGADIETWSLTKIVEETLEQYKLSLADAEKSKQVKIEVYEPTMYKGNVLGRQYRPTLYDFLAHRAVDFFSGSEPDIAKPAYSFEIDQSTYLSDANAFAQLTISSKDSLSMKFHALTILQDLIRFHLNDKDLGALVDVDLKRLKLVRAHLTLSNKDDLYVQALELLEKKVKDTPLSGLVVVEKARVLVEHAAQYKPLGGEDHKWDLKKAYDLCEVEKKRFPNADGAILCENLQEDILTKSIRATVEETNVPGQPFRSLVRYKNFTTLYYRIIKTTRAEVREQRKKLERNYNVDREEELIKYFAGKSPIKSGQYTLPDDGDYQEHSLEVKLDALPEGEYMVLYSHQAGFDTKKNGMAYTFTVISNISFTHRSLKDGSIEVNVLHRQSGEALADVKVTVYARRYNSKTSAYERIKINTFTSDARGYVKIDYLKSDEYRSFSMDFSKGADFNSTEDIDQGSYYYGGTINQYRYERDHARTQTALFTGRGRRSTSRGLW
jgi:hypothetical protein